MNIFLKCVLSRTVLFQGYDHSWRQKEFIVVFSDILNYLLLVKVLDSYQASAKDWAWLQFLWGSIGLRYACYCYVKIFTILRKCTFYTKLYFSVLTVMTVELVHVAVQEYIVTCFIYRLKKNISPLKIFVTSGSPLLLRYAAVSL